MDKHEILENAYHYCMMRGLRLTEPRKQVLKILVNEKKPLGAYDILQRLSLKVKNPKPPTVYRAIQFWLQQGYIHCIDSLKSYVPCLHGHHVGQAQFVICGQCDFVQELDCHVDCQSIFNEMEKMNFSISDCTIEIKGICQRCQ